MSKSSIPVLGPTIKMGDEFQCSMCVFLLKEIQTLKKEMYQSSIQPSCLDQLVENLSTSCGTQTHDSIFSPEQSSHSETHMYPTDQEVPSPAKPPVDSQDVGCGTDDLMTIQNC